MTSEEKMAELKAYQMEKLFSAWIKLYPDMPSQVVDAVREDSLRMAKAKDKGGLVKYEWRHQLSLLADPWLTLDGGNGWCIWSAGEVLSDYVAAHPDLFQGKACLELGAGTGAVGMTLMKQGASSVVLTDVEQQLPLLQQNVNTNFGSNDAINVCALDWTSSDSALNLKASTRNWQVIVGSDIVYDEELYKPLLKTLAALCSFETAVYLALSDRKDEEGVDHLANFIDAARDDFDCNEVHERRFEANHSTTKVFRMTTQLKRVRASDR
eukprot:gnl/MRDRNA2_/MRDRNA2_74209_c0_seq3.p1 gnl/MRDRNA2_/MRDRNA2_74209_c0~~gnl/MRDRNA2_/MRDRNA2_74209_c0_seq3.p1  ORF type:complete len:268 (-),score=62.23 gnl/MRDRNA2_/MRDRNA2_74209_c0_seq3:102-905(-)